jgi:hypothetical protein
VIAIKCPTLLVYDRILNHDAERWVHHTSSFFLAYRYGENNDFVAEVCDKFFPLFSTTFNEDAQFISPMPVEWVIK